jgi:hypothetical protein
MNSPWSDPLPLCRYREAPREKGLYLIGTSNIDSLPVKAGDSSDLYLGENFPDNFFMLYVGQSIDGKSTIRKRLSAHACGRGNKYIGALARINYPLFFVTRAGREEAGLEVAFLIGIDPPPIFNKRDERTRSSRRLYREVWAGVSQAEKDRISRQVALDDEFDPY